MAVSKDGLQYRFVIPGTSVTKVRQTQAPMIQFGPRCCHCRASVISLTDRKTTLSYQTRVRRWLA